MAIKRKLMKVTDWFLLGRAGDLLLTALVLAFCLLVAMACLLIGTEIDKTKCSHIDEPVEYIRL